MVDIEFVTELGVVFAVADSALDALKLIVFECFPSLFVPDTAVEIALGADFLAPTPDRTVLRIERGPSLEGLTTARTLDRDLSLALVVGTGVRAVGASTERGGIPEVVAAVVALSSLVGSPIGDTVSGEPVGYRRFGHATVVGDVAR
ncbi:hypothetical protein ACFQER_12685 [Halomicroarcula sp. GCM10025894]|uniref:hypothetical protein n=1 Tax=Halomicroarcula sp. GCM10025894 TaxID=3252673 RepID=UPI00361FBB9B